jgi:hypothetical protein
MPQHTATDEVMAAIDSVSAVVSLER